MTDERRTKMLERVRALLAKADSTNFPEEADSFRAKADQIMAEYTIGEWELSKARNEGGTKPEVRDFPMDWYISHSQASYIYSMMSDVARHCRCNIVYWRGLESSFNADFSERTTTIKVVGMPNDLDFLDMLFTSLMLELAKGLEPKPDPDKPMIENLVRMKEAGMKWGRIGSLLYEADQLDAPYTRNTGVRFTKLYTDYCEAHNRPRLRTSPSVYQRSFASGFTGRIWERLREIQKRSAIAQQESSDGGTGTGLVLADIKQRVDYFTEQEFPRPKATGGRARRGRAVAQAKYDHSAAADGAAAASKVDLGSSGKINTGRGSLPAGS